MNKPQTEGHIVLNTAFVYIRTIRCLCLYEIYHVYFAEIIGSYASPWKAVSVIPVEH